MKKNPNSFVRWEIEFFRSECNFTPDEQMFFELRYEGDVMSLEEIAGQMGYSTSKISDTSRAVEQKMEKVRPIKDAYLKKYCDNYG